MAADFIEPRRFVSMRFVSDDAEMNGRWAIYDNKKKKYVTASKGKCVTFGSKIDAEVAISHLKTK